MKRFYYAVNLENENGKLYAAVMSASEQTNIANQLKRDKIWSCNPCETKKRAHELVDFWNEQYKKNGTYAY